MQLSVVTDKELVILTLFRHYLGHSQPSSANRLTRNIIGYFQQYILPKIVHSVLHYFVEFGTFGVSTFYALHSVMLQKGCRPPETGTSGSPMISEEELTLHTLGYVLSINCFASPSELTH